MKRKTGRPADYNEEIAERLCRAIATSSDGLRVICARNPKFPSRTTIYKWIAENPNFANRYARAKQFQAQAIFDEIITIADQTRMGTVTKIDSRGKRERRIGDMTDRARLQVDARKWCLSKLLPKVYGDQPEVDVGREDPVLLLIEEMRRESKRIGPPEGEVMPADDEEILQ